MTEAKSTRAPTQEDLVPPPITSPLDLGRFVWRARQFARLYWRLFRDPRVPRGGRWGIVFAALAAAAYLVSPIDLIPAWLIPIIGAADDFVVCVFLLREGVKAMVRKTPPDVFTEHVERLWRTAPPPLLTEPEKEQPDKKQQREENG